MEQKIIFLIIILIGIWFLFSEKGQLLLMNASNLLKEKIPEKRKEKYSGGFTEDATHG